MKVTQKDYNAAIERLFQMPPSRNPGDNLYISSDTLKALMAGELDNVTLMFSNGCIFLGKTLRMLLEDQP